MTDQDVIHDAARLEAMAWADAAAAIEMLTHYCGHTDEDAYSAVLSKIRAYLVRKTIATDKAASAVKPPSRPSQWVDFCAKCGACYDPGCRGMRELSRCPNCGHGYDYNKQEDSND